MSDGEEWKQDDDDDDKTPVPLWNSFFFGKPMTKAEQAEYERKNAERREREKAAAELRAMTLTGYRPEAACVKCGGTTIKVRFCAETKEPRGWGGDDACFAHTAGREHLHRICKSCRYVWYELPLDASQ